MKWVSPRAFLLLFAMLGAVAFFGGSDAWVTTRTSFSPKPIPAFYAGGLRQGSGGQLEYNSINSQELFSPSPAKNSSQVLLPNALFPDPASCGSCHAGIHDQWTQSLHAKSATDALYLKVKDQFVVERGEPAVRLCAGCHAPVALMTGEVGLYNKESASSQQGVSCGFCHTIKAVHGDSGAWEINPARVRKYVGGDVFSPTPNIGDQLARQLLYAKPRAHREDMLSDVLTTGQACKACHEFNINGVAVQSTWSEYTNSSYPQKGISCQSCHFSKTGKPNSLEPGEVALGRARGGVQWHTLRGGSTLISANPEANQAMLQNALKLEATFKSNRLEVLVKNTGAAHAIPTGVADLRQLWLEVRGFDAAGQEIFSSGVLDKAGEFAANTRVFHQVLADETGRKLLRHEIWQAKKIILDTRIPADGARLELYQMPKGIKTVKLRLLWRDVPAEFAAWVLQKSATQIPIRVVLERVIVP
jgi:hypothetical protein